MRSTLSALNNTLHAFVVPLSSFFLWTYICGFFIHSIVIERGEKKVGKNALERETHVHSLFLCERACSLHDWLIVDNAAARERTSIVHTSSHYFNQVPRQTPLQLDLFCLLVLIGVIDLPICSCLVCETSDC